MNRYILNVVLFVTALSISSCSSAPKFSDVAGKEWKLIEVRVKPESIRFDRSTLISEGFGEIFTLNFDAERKSGMAAPNRYFAPYTLGKNQEITVKTIGGTLMAPLKEPEKLKEREFFSYLQKAYKWDISLEGRFELLTKGPDGGEATLVFTLE
jgi:heat shock protein HslJ